MKKDARPTPPSPGASIDPTTPHGGNLRIGRSSELCWPYHVTKCLPRPSATSLAQANVANVIIRSIRWHQEQGLAHLLAFVVMPDHVHWLFVLDGSSATEARNLPAIMDGFGKFTSLRINRSLNRSGQFWQLGYHDHRVRTDAEEAMVVIEYIHANPVRRGLCARPEDWPWSTAHEPYAGWIEHEWLW